MSAIKHRRYDTSPRIRGRKLQEIRKRFFEHNPLCAECLKEGRATLATELDHIIPLFKGGKDTDDNRQGLCTEHHRIKTNKDMGFKQTVQIGIDGFPIGK